MFFEGFHQTNIYLGMQTLKGYPQGNIFEAFKLINVMMDKVFMYSQRSYSGSNCVTFMIIWFFLTDVVFHVDGLCCNTWACLKRCVWTALQSFAKIIFTLDVYLTKNDFGILRSYPNLTKSPVLKISS